MATTTTTTKKPVAAPEGSPPSNTPTTPAVAPETTSQGAPVAAAATGIPVRTPYEWAKSKGIDPALVDGAAVLAGWPKGNLLEGSLLLDETDFDKALEAFTGMEIG